MEKIQLLLQDVSNQILQELLHSCVDDVCERKRQHHYDNFKSCTNWSKDEYDLLHIYFRTLICEVLEDPSPDQILEQCPGLSSDHVQCVHDCLLVRKIDIENLLLNKSFAVSGPKLQDFDWKLKWVMGSSALSSLREPLLLLDFMLHETGDGKNLYEENINQHLIKFLDHGIIYSLYAMVIVSINVMNALTRLFKTSNLFFATSILPIKWKSEYYFKTNSYVQEPYCIS